MALTQQALQEFAADINYQKRVQTAITASALSIANNGASSTARVALARAVLGNSIQYATMWALGVRVAGANITLDTLTDAQVTNGGDAMFTALAGA